MVSVGKRQFGQKGYVAFLLYNLAMKTIVEEHITRHVTQDQHFLCIFFKPQSPHKILVHLLCHDILMLYVREMGNFD